MEPLGPRFQGVYRTSPWRTPRSWCGIFRSRSRVLNHSWPESLGLFPNKRRNESSSVLYGWRLKLSSKNNFARIPFEPLALRGPSNSMYRISLRWTRFEDRRRVGGSSDWKGWGKVGSGLLDLMRVWKTTESWVRVLSGLWKLTKMKSLEYYLCQSCWSSNVARTVNSDWIRRMWPTRRSTIRLFLKRKLVNRKCFYFQLRKNDWVWKWQSHWSHSGNTSMNWKSL